MSGGVLLIVVGVCAIVVGVLPERIGRHFQRGGTIGQLALGTVLITVGIVLLVT